MSNKTTTDNSQAASNSNTVHEVKALLQTARELEAAGDPRGAMVLLDRILDMAPTHPKAGKLRRAILDAFLWKLVEEGIASWSGGKPTGSKNPVKLTPGPPVSDYIIEDRG